MTLQRFNYWFVGSGILFSTLHTILLALVNSSNISDGYWFLLIVVMLVPAPFALLFVCNMGLVHNTRLIPLMIFIAAAVTYTAYIFIFVTGFYLPEYADAQNGLLLFFVPIYLFLFNVALIVGSLLLRRFIVRFFVKPPMH